MHDIKPFTASKRLHRFRNRVGTKNIITGEAESLEKAAVIIPPAELKKLIKEKGCHPKQNFNWKETTLLEGDVQKDLIKVQRRHEGIKHRRTD